MDNFYKQFKDRISGRREPDFREEDWKAMEQKLNPTPPANVQTFPFPIWLLAIPFLGLLGWNVYLQTNQSTNDTLIDDGKSIGKILQTDTVYEERIIYSTDTVFLDRVIERMGPTRIIEKIVYRDNSEFDILPNTGLRVAQGRDQISRHSPMTNSDLRNPMEKSLVPNINSTISLNPEVDQEYDTDFVSQKLNSNWGELKSLELGVGKRKQRFLPDVNVEPINSFSSMKKAQALITPQGLGVYGGAGLISTFDTDLVNLFSYDWTLGVKINFIAGYNIWLDASLQNFKFKASAMNDDLGVPVVAPPSDEFKFENAEVPRRSIQWTAGIEYAFNKQKRLRPIIGIGVSAVEYFASEIIYDFVNTKTDEEWIFEIDSEVEALAFNYGILKAGFEYSLDQRWSANLMGTFRKSFGNDAFGHNDVVGVRLSLYSRLF